jgi:hypothetical protein
MRARRMYLHGVNPAGRRRRTHRGSRRSRHRRCADQNAFYIQVALEGGAPIHALHHRAHEGEVGEAQLSAAGDVARNKNITGHTASLLDKLVAQ